MIVVEIAIIGHWEEQSDRKEAPFHQREPEESSSSSSDQRRDSQARRPPVLA